MPAAMRAVGQGAVRARDVAPLVLSNVEARSAGVAERSPSPRPPLTGGRSSRARSAGARSGEGGGISEGGGDAAIHPQVGKSGPRDRERNMKKSEENLVEAAGVEPTGTLVFSATYSKYDTRKARKPLERPFGSTH